MGSSIGALRGRRIVAISVTCPNGHVLKVKNEFAGKSGLCPECHSRVFVPMPVHKAEEARISDDEILGLLGPPNKVQAAQPRPPFEPVPDSIHDAPPEGSGITLRGSSILEKQKVCPHCAHLASIAFTNCPRCGTRLPELGAAKK